ncbi:MAG: cob(I)yrinic acid a,c-diamide adenosyltransferase [Tannerellaceae bacterium]|nr:cob(I)yrinic acid a,c-diamide adenosyltransferase [Tannerellaceae bacterium]
MKKSMLYTKTGDKGTTSLVGGKRVAKTDKRIETYGTTDELNAFTGLLITEINEKEDLEFLRFVQHQLFSIGAYLATDPESAGPKAASRISPATIGRIEGEIDRIDSLLPPLKHFVLPGGGRAASLAHVCRTVCRRAERQIYALDESEAVEKTVLVFINRLSDYFFALARKESLKNGEEIIWDYSCI